MGRLISILFLSCVVAVGAFCEEGKNDYEIRRSKMSLSAGLAFDGGPDIGYSYMMKTSSFIGRSPFLWGFNSASGLFGSKLAFESGLHAGIGGALLGDHLGGEASVGLGFGGSVDTSSQRYESKAPAALVGLALAFPYRADWDLALHFEAFIRPYDQSTSSWGFGDSYCCLYVALDLKSRTEARSTKWSEGLAAE
jgi:hypothetical protein